MEEESPPAFVPSADSIFYDERITSLSSVGLTVTNFGFFGNNLRNRSPSFEYPLGSLIDHLVRAGIWVGGFNTETGETLVTTGTIDGYYNRPPNEDTEFTPYPYTKIIERSTLPNSKYYDPENAISEQDFVVRYRDIPAIDKARGEDHKPLGLEVSQETFAWSFEPSDAFVLVRLFIKNTCGSGCYLRDIYVGLYAELATGYKGGYTTWPPSGWFQKKDIEYADSLSLLMQHHFQSETGTIMATSWSGTQVLGWRGNLPGDTLQTVSFNWWTWAPGATDKDQDIERYRLMSNGEVDDAGGVEADEQCETCDPTCRPVRCDPVHIHAVGPFEIPPDSTIMVSFAFVGGDNREDLIKNAEWAREVFEADFVTYTPPPSPNLRVFPQKGKLALRWDDSSVKYRDPKSGKQDFEGFRVYVSEDNRSFRLIKQADIDTNTIGYNTGLQEIEVQEDSVFVDGEWFTYNYSYPIGGLKDGFKYWVAVTAYDTGEIDIPSTESGLAFNKTMTIPGPSQEERDPKVTVFPNPYRGRAAWDGGLPRDRFIWFANLPLRAEINVYTLSGDLIDTIDFDSSTYSAQDVRGVVNPGGELPGGAERTAFPRLSGSMCAWDLITKHDQAVATGLYIFSVRDKDSGKVEVGKFLILK